LLRANGHVVLTDFGTVRLVTEEPSADQETGEIRDRKNSFVGSAEYVSPEILSDEPCGFASDLWSLGCMLYTLLEGRSPFRAGTEYLTFQKILAGEVSFPHDFPADAQDLILKLLVKNPSQRLGAPPRGISELKSHRFFHGIDFDRINHESAPVKSRAKPELEGKSLHDGRVDAGTASRSREANKKWKRFLRASEEIVLCGFVQKRRGLFGKRRLLILSDYPRFVYVDVEKMEKKGDIPWSSSLYAELKNQNTFYIHTPTRSYYLQSEDVGAKDWVEEINKPKKNFKQDDESKSGQLTKS
jgi:3-phosphoinositide dependent protein kinase-1